MKQDEDQYTGEIAFESLRETDSDDYSAAMTIYATAFPPEERQPAELIRGRVLDGNNQLIIGRLYKQVVFMALLWPFENSLFVLLDYMTTHPGWRGQKIATRFLTHMKNLLLADGKYCILETEDPSFGLNRQQRKRRLQFYRASGAQQLAGIRFRLPALQPGPATDMLLMIFPEWKHSTIEAALVKALIIRIYKELYNRTRADALENSSGYTGKSLITLTSS